MKELQPLIEQLTEIIKGTKDFTVAQSPDFIRQFLIKSYLDAIGWAMFSSFFIFLAWRIARYAKKNWEDTEEGTLLAMLLLAILIGIPGLLGLVENIEDIFVIWLAPKAWIVSELVRSMAGAK